MKSLDLCCYVKCQTIAKRSEYCVSISIDAVILLVIVNLTKTCITVCSQGLVFYLGAELVLEHIAHILYSHPPEIIVESIGSLL